MRSVRTGLLAVLAAVVVPWMSLGAQTGRVRGVVRDSTGNALTGAVVSVEGTALRARTGNEGGWDIRGVPSGARTLRVRLIGYAPVSADVTIPAGGEVTHDFVLARPATQLAPVDVVVGSRARHSAVTELAVAVDVIPAEVIARHGTSEASQILAEVSPSVNFPRQSVADASDIVRPFTLRGQSPDHALVLVNGWRRHRTALVHNFAAGMASGASGVDMNAIPTSAIDRMDILRDGAAAQYGSDAIAGVVNVILKEGGNFSPFLNADVGRYETGDFPSDGETYNVGGGWGRALGRGSLSLFGELRHRNPTNRAGADPEDQIVPGDADDIDAFGNVIHKNNAVPQPNHHWGDGLAKDVLAFANARLPIGSGGTELFAFGGYSNREGTGNGFRRQGISARNWPQIYPLGYLPEFHPAVIDASGAGGIRGTAGKWSYDAGASWGHNSFDYDLRNTMNVSLGPCLATACAPGLDGILGNADDPGIPNKRNIFAGTLRLNEGTLGANFNRQWDAGLAAPVNVAVGVQFRRETYEIVPGEKASYVQGGHLNRDGEQAPPGSQVFAGFQPSNAVDASRTNGGAYLDLEGNLTTRLLATVATRFENYSDFGSSFTGKVAVRYQPSTRLTLRGALSTGFRAPALSQSYYGTTVTNFVLDQSTGRQRPVEVGIYPVDHPAARALGAKPLEEETSTNLSAGFAYSPTNDVTVTMDFYSIAIKGWIILTSEIAGDSVARILANKGLYAERAQYFTNALDTKTNGIDLTASWRTRLGASGRLELSNSFNWTRNRIDGEVRNPPELNGTGAALFDPYLSGGTIALEKERPEWRNTLQAEYQNGRFRGILRNAFYGKYTTAQLGACADCVQTIGAAGVVDAEAGFFTPWQVNVSIGAKNLFDTYPDRLIPDNSFGIFLYPQGSPFGYNGRYVYLRTEWTFGK